MARGAASTGGLGVPAAGDLTPSGPGRVIPPGVPEREEPAGRPWRLTGGSNSSTKKSKSLVAGGDDVVAKGNFVSSKVT